MVDHRFTTGVLVGLSLSLFLLSCQSLPLAVVPDPVISLQEAVRTEIEGQIGDLLGSELRHYEVLDSRLQGEGNFGRVEARVVLENCPLFNYDLQYNAELKDGEWVLYTDDDTMPNLFKRWATARSAALAGETVDVPGTMGQRHVFLLPDGIPELMRARLDGFSSATVDPLVGFFICQQDEINWDGMDDELADEIRLLTPLVREAMSAELADQTRSE
jgi:hypothetical protein